MFSSASGAAGDVALFENETTKVLASLFEQKDPAIRVMLPDCKIGASAAHLERENPQQIGWNPLLRQRLEMFERQVRVSVST